MPTQSPSSVLPTLSSARTTVHSPDRSICADAGLEIASTARSRATILPTWTACVIVFPTEPPTTAGLGSPKREDGQVETSEPAAVTVSRRVYCAGQDSQS